MNPYIHQHFSQLSLINPLNIYKRSEIAKHIGVVITKYQMDYILKKYFIRKSFGYYAFKYGTNPHDA